MISVWMQMDTEKDQSVIILPVTNTEVCSIS